MGTTLGNFQKWPVDQELVATGLGAPSVARQAGDLLYYDITSHTVKPFSSLTALASEALDQAAVAPYFLGVSNAQALSTISAQDDSRIIDDMIFQYPCVSGTFEFGDFVGPTRNGGAALADQVLAKVTNPALAIGRAWERKTSAVTSIKVRLMNRFNRDFGNSPGEGAFGQGQGSALMADAAVTLTVAALPIQTMVPTAARVVTLPAEAQSAGRFFLIVNQSAGANTITVKNAAAATVIAIAQAKTGMLFCDGTTWFGLLGA